MACIMPTHAERENIMKWILPALLAFCIPAFGLTFKGEFTYTITSLSRPADGLAVGDSFGGKYVYESDTIDGTFYGAWTGDDLTGQVLIPYPINPYGVDSLIALDTQNPMITVSGGVVTDFRWHPTLGPLDLNLDFATMSFGRSY